MWRPLAAWPRETTATELLDDETPPARELAGNLRDLARLNGLTATRALLARVAPFMERSPRDRPLSVLDVGTGGADIPVALVRWARRRGRSVRVLALDLRTAVLRCAARATDRLPEIHLVAGDALHLPVRAGVVDLALCSLTLHHLPEAGVTALLRLLGETARLGFVVSDLRRSRTAYAAVWLTTRLVSRNPLTRHDGPLSVRRAYTRTELARLAAAAGLDGMQWYDEPFFRILGVHARR